MDSEDPELQEMVARWCASTAPRGQDSLYAIEVVAEGAKATIASGVFESGPLHSSGCLQDMLLSALVFELEKDGVIDVSAPIGEVLHELNVGSGPGGAVRVADLLCHASGLRAPDMTQVERAYGGWSPFCEYLISRPRRFPPGSVIDYDILERILLVEYLRRRLLRNPYRLIEDRYLPGLNAKFDPSTRYTELGLESLKADLSSLRTVIERLLKDANGWFRRACLPASPGSIKIFDETTISKDFVPLVNSWGVLSFGNFLWGQNGAAETTFVGTRFDEDREMLLIGAFASKYERDLILNEICDRLGYAVAEGPRSKKVGFLNGFSPERLCGSYDGANRGPIEISIDKNQLILTWLHSDATLRFFIDDDGYLTSRFSWPAFWLQPFTHPESGVDCITVNQMTAARI